LLYESGVWLVLIVWPSWAPLGLAFGQASLCQVASDDIDMGLASDSGV
jgi:hypothetical protein